ncbi:MAG TPA: Na+/H+ antiporter NhaC [Chitinophagales bacterium]|nr:Na+/H+ antiporter NhaC [Chitinophagales bacterium]HPR28396.1 Na+/H+ antiporter NhaC [Chitinophagales bacterium]HRX24469.1 Na+/H+ antiporter NhaC [Chitinophagales bacterium]
MDGNLYFGATNQTAFMDDRLHPDGQEPGILHALLPVLVLVGLLVLNVLFFGDMATSGANQIALIIAAAVAAVMGLMLKVPLSHMIEGVVHSIMSAMNAILILLLIGALAGTWLISGVVPAMIYYGLQILNPTIFLFAACIICAVVSLATGSSWSTVATVGIALLGIGQAMGVNEGWIAGAIISGAYFGDKMSPMSDTTNLAPAMAGTDLFTHIRYMVLTTVPSMVITLLLFLFIGFFHMPEVSPENMNALGNAIHQSFHINIFLFIVPAVVIWMIIKKADPITALLIGSLLGGVVAIIFQPEVVAEVSGITGSYAKQSYMAVVNAMSGSISVSSDNEIAAGLLSARGMAGMLNTIWLIVCAMCFGGVMESVGLLARITRPLVERAKTTGSLIATTATSCVFLNVTASDQYLAIVVPGRMFAKTFRQRGLAPQNLSRTLEDSGTVTSVLVPWNTCGATQAGVLGVATLTYLPFCFFCIISPLMTILYGYLGIRIAKIPSDDPMATA